MLRQIVNQLRGTGLEGDASVNPTGDQSATSRQVVCHRKSRPKVFLNHGVAFPPGDTDHRMAELFRHIEAYCTTGPEDRGDVNPLRIEQKTIHVKDNGFNLIGKNRHRIGIVHHALVPTQRCVATKLTTIQRGDRHVVVIASTPVRRVIIPRSGSGLGAANDTVP